MIEKLEEKEDKSFVMAPLCKLRNYCYSVAASCFRSSFNQEFLVRDCQVLQRTLEDLQRDSMNDFIFQNLMTLLKSLKKDRNSIVELFEQHALTLIELIKDMEESPGKRVSLIKIMVYLILRAP